MDVLSFLLVALLASSTCEVHADEPTLSKQASSNEGCQCDWEAKAIAVNHDLINELNNTRLTLVDQYKDLAELRVALADAHRELNDSQLKLAATRRELNAARMTKAAEEADIAKQQQDAHDSFRTLRNKLDEARSSARLLNTSLIKAQSIARQKAFDLNAARLKEATLASQLSDVKQELNATRQALETASQHGYKSIMGQLNAAKLKEATLASQLSDVRQELNATRQKLETASQQGRKSIMGQQLHSLQNELGVAWVLGAICLCIFALIAFSMLRWLRCRHREEIDYHLGIICNLHENRCRLHSRMALETNGTATSIQRTDGSKPDSYCGLCGVRLRSSVTDSHLGTPLLQNRDRSAANASPIRVAGPCVYSDLSGSDPIFPDRSKYGISIQAAPEFSRESAMGIAATAAFNAMDRNHDGVISRSEFTAAFRQPGAEASATRQSDMTLPNSSIDDNSTQPVLNASLPSEASDQSDRKSDRKRKWPSAQTGLSAMVIHYATASVDELHQDS